MLKEDHATKLDAEGKRLLDTVLENTKMMGELIDDLLAFSRVAALVADNESVDMGLLVQQCLDRIVPPGSCPFVSVGTLPECKGDNSMLRQVWYNLLHNALKFASKKEAPQIKIGSLENKGCNIYYVKDNGAGFDGNMPIIFLAFFNACTGRRNLKARDWVLLSLKELSPNTAVISGQKHRHNREPPFISAFQKGNGYRQGDKASTFTMI
jgi:light-regulated signal transduction histidine kinase (bacteriophytochrome)